MEPDTISILNLLTSHEILDMLLNHVEPQFSHL